MSYVDKTKAGNVVKNIHDTSARNMIAYTETSNSATIAYSQGDFFIYNDVLYRATTIINIGDAIIPNTNCIAVILTDVIKQLVHI